MSNWKKLRQMKKLSQRQLADLTGLNQSIISLLESGKLIPTEIQIEKLKMILLPASKEKKRETETA